MGKLCVECNRYLPIKKVTDALGNSPRKGDDAILFYLECGHVVGLNEANEYIKAVREIDSEYLGKKRALDAERQKQVTAVMQVMIAKKRGEA